MKTAKAIFKYHLLSFSRLKMSTFKAPPDFIAIVISIGFISVLTVALAYENPLIVDEIKILNFNYIVALFYIISFFSEAYILSLYTPNYRYIKLLIPNRATKQICIDTLSEIVSYKLFILLFVFVAFFVLSSTYKIALWEKFNIIGILLIILSYLNSCLLIQLIKDKMRKNAFNLNTNLFKLLFFLLLAISIVNSNLNIVNFKDIKVMYALLLISTVLPFIFLLIIFRINVKQDRI